MFDRFIELSAQPVFRYATALFIFSLAVNLVCFNWTEAPIIYPDSHGYIKPALQLKQGRLPDFSMRSPAYPMYLVVMGLVGQIVNRPPLKLAVYGQIVLGAITIVLLYLICLKLLKREWLAFSVSAFLGLNFQVINYQSAVLTETFATTSLMAVLYVHIAALYKKITLKRLFLMVLIDSLLVMIRPNFVLLPATLYALHILDLFAKLGNNAGGLNSASSSISFLVLGISCNMALIATWVTLYSLQTGHLGLSRTSHFNLLGKAIQYGYLDQDYADPPRIARQAQEIYRQVERNQDPYSVINRLGSEGLYSVDNLRSINSYFLAGRKADFVLKTAQLLPIVLNKQSPFYYGRPKGSYQNPWLHRIMRGFDLLNTLNSKAVLFAGGFAFYLWAKNRRKQFVALIMILGTVLYHLITITAFGYSEYPRLRSPIDLLLNVLGFLCFFALCFVCWQTHEGTVIKIRSKRRLNQLMTPSAQVTKRRLPYPYKGLLAICSDVDATSPWEFIRIHRFLNTLTPAIPYYGNGVGLDIGDSFFFKNISNNGLSICDACYRYRNEEAWADEFGGEAARAKDPKNARDPVTGRLVFVGGPNFIEKYIRCGWIDVLHGGDGNWAEFAFKRRATDWRRTDGQHYVEWMARRGLKIDTFTNHSAVSSDFGVPDKPSTGKKPRSIGDVPDSTAYWADCARQAGIKFYWSYIPNESAAYRPTFGRDTLLVPATFRDGNKFWHFSRYSGGGHHADRIGSILNAYNLDCLVRANLFEIAYTHFGYWSDNTNRVNPELSAASIDAFRLLKCYQDEGKILVAKTSRLLRYNLALDHLDFTTTHLNESTTINISAIKDTQFDDFTPTIRDLRGITFYVPDPCRAEIQLSGTRVPETEIQRNSADETGKQSIGIKWFQPDYTDYTTWTPGDVNGIFSR